MVIHVMNDHQINDNCFNNLGWDVHVIGCSFPGLQDDSFMVRGDAAKDRMTVFSSYENKEVLSVTVLLAIFRNNFDPRSSLDQPQVYPVSTPDRA